MNKALLILLVLSVLCVFMGGLPESVGGNPSATTPTYEGVWGSGPCMDTAYDGKYIYYLGSRTGLEVLDITEPIRPIKIAGIYLPAHPDGEPATERELLVRDGYAYITAFYSDTEVSRFQVVDLGDPSAPVAAGHLVFSGRVTGLAMKNGFAFVSIGEGGVNILDVRNPFSPTLVGSHFIDTNTLDVAVGYKNNLVYAVNTNSMRIIDVSIPASPVLVGTYTLTDNDISCVAIGANGNFAFIGGYGGWVTVDISDPGAPKETNFFQLPYIQGIKIENNTAFVSTSHSISLFDITSPSSPRQLGQWSNYQSILGTAVADGYLYAANYVEGLKVLDISDPADLKAIGEYNQVSEGLFGVTARDSMLYTLHSSNIHILDAGNASSAYLTGKSEFSGIANSIRIRDHYAYLSSSSGFHILDISNPRQPAILGRYSTPWAKTYGTALRDNLAYTVRAGDRLEAIDISDPTTPATVSYLDGIAIGGIEIVEDYAYVISSIAGLQVIDISNPRSMTLTAVIPVNVPAETPGWYELLVIQPLVRDGYLYIPGHRGLEVLDISRPDTPVPAAVAGTGQTATWAAIAGDYAYVILNDGGISLFDISQPTAPRLAGALDIPYGARHIYASGNHLYITALNHQVHIYRTGLCNPVQLNAPTGGKICALGTVQEISWNLPETVTNGNTINLELYQDNHRVGTIAENLPAASGTFSWTVGTAADGNILIVPGNRFNIGLRVEPDNCLTLSPGQFTIPESGISLDIECEMGRDSSLFFSRLCARVDITVHREPGAVEVSHYILKRRSENGVYEQRERIPADRVQNGTYRYFDCNMQEYGSHEYYVEAIHTTGAIIAVSQVEKIED